MIRFKYLPLYLLFVSLAAAQSAPSAPAPLPKDPLELIKLAAPHYDFDDAAMKPWHMKASYQLYDAMGNPTEKGSYEQWWASPKVHRESWTRGGETRTEWFTAGGEYFDHKDQMKLHYFEDRYSEELFLPLAFWKERPAAEVPIKLEKRKVGDLTYPCVSVGAHSSGRSKIPANSDTLGYCFDAKLPVLRAWSDSSALNTTYNSISQFQDKYLPRDVAVFVNGVRLFSAHIEEINGIDVDAPQLKPTADAILQNAAVPESIHPKDDVAVGRLLSKQQPVYPSAAKANREQGIVLMAAKINKGGSIQDLEVLYTPSSLLAGAATDAVAQWKYKPYLLKGEPIEVETVVKVYFSLGR